MTINPQWTIRMGTTLFAAEPAAEMTIRDDSLYEVVDGVRLEEQPMAVNSVWLADGLKFLLDYYLRQNGLPFTTREMLFQLRESPTLRRRPDLAYISEKNWPTEKLGSEEAWKVVPDLAVEVVSPSNSATEIEQKINEYLEAGVQTVWVVYPELRKITTYDVTQPMARLSEGDRLTGGTALPGFEVALTEVFSILDRTPQPAQAPKN